MNAAYDLVKIAHITLNVSTYCSVKLEKKHTLAMVHKTGSLYVRL